MTILFGANDSCAFGQTQHVPMDAYARNLREMMEYEGVKTHNTRTVLITPSPVEEYRLVDGNNRAPTVARYAQAVRELGRAMNVPVFDLWSILMAQAGWNTDREPCDAHARVQRDATKSNFGKVFLGWTSLHPLRLQRLFGGADRLYREGSSGAQSR